MLLFGEHGAEAVGVDGELRLDAGDERLGLVGATADDGGGADVVLAEIAGGREVQGIELGGALELVADLAGEREGGDGTGVGGLHAVSAAEPEMVVAAGGVVGGGELALREWRSRPCPARNRRGRGADGRGHRGDRRRGWS